MWQRKTLCNGSVLKHCAVNTKRRLSALPNVGPYIYDVKISGFTRSCIYIYTTLVGWLIQSAKWTGYRLHDRRTCVSFPDKVEIFLFALPSRRLCCSHRPCPMGIGQSSAGRSSMADWSFWSVQWRLIMSGSIRPQVQIRCLSPLHSHI
jgi:hypothetical protein